MAGILDKKERVIDYKITNNGRSQIQDGDIRYVYATFSDSGIIYNELDKSLTDSKRNISDETQFLPFEVTSKVNDVLNPEFDLKNFLTSNENSDISEEGITFNDAIQKIKDTEVKNNNVSLSKKLINLKLLDTKSENEFTGIKFANETDVLQNNSFAFNLKENYPTLYNKNQSYKELSTLIADKRLSNKTPFKRLIPVNNQNVQLYNDNDFKKYYSDQNDEFYVLKEYNNPINEINDEDDIDSSILKTVDALLKDNKVYKKEYVLSEYSREDTFIFNMYENDGDIIKNYSINKLSFIDLGEKFDKRTGKSKRIFLVGKIIKTRNEDDIDVELVYSFNKGVIQKNTNSSQIPLSIYYSFVCMFTLVLE